MADSFSFWRGTDGYLQNNAYLCSRKTQNRLNKIETATPYIIVLQPHPGHTALEGSLYYGQYRFIDQ